MIRHALSSSQQGLWFLSRIDPRVDAAYNVVLALRASGPIDPIRLQRTLHILQARHEALRCRIVSELGVPAIEVEDAAQTTAWRLVQRTGDLRRIASEEGNRPFDIEVPPLARAVLVTPADESQCHGLVFVIPHLLFDDASARVLMQDLQRIDRALLQGEDPMGPVPAGSLLEAIDRELALAGGQKMKALATAAAERLTGMPERLTLPGSNGSADALQVYAGAAVEFEFSAGLVDALRVFLRQQRSTPAAGCLAAFLLLLWKASGQPDFGVNVAMSNRGGEVMQQVIGYFTNVGIVRARIDPMETVAQFLARLNEQWWDLLDTSELPFPLLAKQVRRRGGDLQAALLQVGFNHLIADDSGFALGTVQLRPLQVLPELVKNQFKLDIQETPGGFRGVLLYDSGAMDREMVQGLADGYMHLLEAMVAEPQARVSNLRLLDSQQVRHWLERWYRPPATGAREYFVHELVQQQAARTPDAVAVICGARTLRYGKLNALANRLARQLRDWGATPQSLIGVCMEPGVDVVVAMVAVLKSGAAYVPLDPAYPAERLAFMLADASAQVVLTQSTLVQALPRSQARLVALDEQWPALDRYCDADLSTRLGADHLAYCIYTSGSTGRPKGALNTHRGVANLATWYAHGEMGMQSGERVLLASSLSFDLTQKNILATLIAGATLVVPEGHVADIDALRAAVGATNPTRINCAPSAYRAFLPALEGSSLSMVVLGGEPVDAQLVADADRRGVTLVNSYGPTECADVAVSHRHQKGSKVRALPLGRPLPGVQVYVLDANLQLVPDGVAGELHIAGVGVGRGYLNRPELTAEKFVPDPFGEAGSRMYRTGDMARVLTGGEIEFLGRLDDQVKIRGFRIELGEVENALRECEGVREAALVVREDEPGDKRLVAYVGAAQPLEAARLRERLQQVLPEHMIPTGWMVLEKLPLSPNGKIDRKALPAPQAQTAPGEGYEPPRNELERRLADIWVQVLKVGRVGLNDNFFALGGHSLLATQVIARTAQEGLGKLTVRTLFDAPTVGRLAAFLQTQPSSTASPAPSTGRIPRLART